MYSSVTGLVRYLKAADGGKSAYGLNGMLANQIVNSTKRVGS